MAVAGIDIRTVVKGALDMREYLVSSRPDGNPALLYACVRNLLYRSGYKLEMLSCFEPQLRWFFKWWIQLFAESEGKERKGLFPVASEYSEELHSVGQYVQDGESMIFETFLDIREQTVSLAAAGDNVRDCFEYLDGKDFFEINKAAFRATRTAHSQKLPCVTFTLDRIDAGSFGELFYFFELACYLSGRILGINPFDQPGVEAYKGWMFRALGK
jgi:glucose-6-phosphate isomerase